MSRSTRTLLIGAAALLAVALVIALTGGDGAPEASTGPSASTTTAEPTDTAPSSTTSTTSTSSSTTSTTTTTTLDARAARLLESTRRVLTESTPRELAYRLVVTGLTGADLRGRLTQTVGSACVGGVFLTESNANWSPVDDPDAFRAARASMPTTCAFPPLVTTDAELGEVVRVPARSPAPAPDWATRYVEGEPYNVLLDLQEQAATYATELRDLGVDVNFGAVADVDTAPDHFMARQGRTFGADPGIVAALANAVVEGHCAAGVAAALKHFPNQGATVEDPHREPSTAIGGIDRWETTGRLPYETTAAPVVMTGHIFMTDVDPDLPASMSAAITTDLLRGDLGYDGVVITDDLSTMRGASDVIPDPGDRAVAAIRAGADLVLFVNDTDIAPVVEALTAAIEADDTFRDRALTAIQRILRLQRGILQPELFPLCGAVGD